MGFEVNDTTYSDGSRKTSQNFKMDSRALVTCDTYFSPTFEWTPKYGINQLRTFGASEKTIYKIHHRTLKVKKLIQRSWKKSQ